MLGRYQYSWAHGGLDSHSHTGVMEICYLAKGMQLYRVGRRDFLMQGGDVFVTFPQEVHSTGQAPQEKGTLYWIHILLPAQPSRFLHCAPEDARGLVSQLQCIPHRHFQGIPLFQKLLDEIISEATGKAHPLSRISMSTKLIEFLLKVVECSRQHPKTLISPGINKLLGTMKNRREEPLTLQEMASFLGLSVSRLKTRFKQEVGIPPAEYFQRCKLDAAKSLLASRKYTITDVAFRLNFSSSQYFATVFKRYTGQTPRGYLKAFPPQPLH